MMRDLFSEYYQPTEKEFACLWKEAVFVFDTNVLLNLYRYSSDTRDDLLSVMEQLQDRIWVPYQVGLEFSRNRGEVISDQKAILDLVDLFDTFVKEKFEKERLQAYGKRGHFFVDLEKLRATFQQMRQLLHDELHHAQDQYPVSDDTDVVLKRLDKLFQGKIGRPYSDDEMAKLTPLFEKRYKDKIPPGFKDEKKQKGQNKQPPQPKPQNELPDDETNNPANKYGDVIIWFQILEYAQQEKKPIILVGDDVKEDWWERRRRGKTTGPRAELRREMRQKAGVEFYMYTMENFIQRARKFIELQVQEKTIKELEEKRVQDEKARVRQDSLYSGSVLFPSVTFARELAQQAQSMQQFVNAVGGLAEFARQVNQAHEAFRYLGSLSSFSVSPSENDNYPLEELPSPDDAEQEQDKDQEQDQQDESSDNGSD
jgi:hypothetical protein